MMIHCHLKMKIFLLWAKSLFKNNLDINNKGDFYLSEKVFFSNRSGDNPDTSTGFKYQLEDKDYGFNISAKQSGFAISSGNNVYLDWIELDEAKKYR